MLTVSLTAISSLHRGFFLNSYTWQLLDIYVYLPVAGISSTSSVFFVTVLSIDRCVRANRRYLHHNGKRISAASAFHRRLQFPHKISIAIISVSVLLNFPSALMFHVDHASGTITHIHNSNAIFLSISWTKQILCTALPSITLVIVNAILVVTIRRSLSRRRTMLPRHRWTDGTRLTSSLITVSVTFLVAEIPSTLAHRDASTYLLYGGDDSKLTSPGHQVFIMVATIVLLVHYSTNFVLYCLVDKRFHRTFNEVFRSRASLNVVVPLKRGLGNETPTTKDMKY